MEANEIDRELLKRAVEFAEWVRVADIDVENRPDGLMLVERTKAVKVFLQHYAEYVELESLRRVCPDQQTKADIEKVLEMVKGDLNRAADRLLQLEAQGGLLTTTVN